MRRIHRKDKKPDLVMIQSPRNQELIHAWGMMRRNIEAEHLCKGIVDRSRCSNLRCTELLEFVYSMADGFGSRIGLTWAFSLLNEFVPGLGDASRKFAEDSQRQGRILDIDLYLDAEGISPLWELAENPRPINAPFLEESLDLKSLTEVNHGR